MPPKGGPPPTSTSVVRVEEMTQLLKVIFDFIALMFTMWRNDMGTVRGVSGHGGGDEGGPGGDGGDMKRRRRSE